MAVRGTLTPATIVAAGRRIGDAEGASALSMRRVAAELGCTPMALYRHVSDKRELLVLLLDDVAAGMPVTVPGGAPDAQLTALFGGLHDYLAGYPWVVDVLREGELYAPRALLFVEAVLGVLASAGVRGEPAVSGYLALWHFTVGHLTVSHPRDPASASLRGELASRAPLEDLPLVREMLPIAAGLDLEAAFRDGLRALASGLLMRS